MYHVTRRGRCAIGGIVVVLLGCDGSAPVTPPPPPTPASVAITPASFAFVSVGDTATATAVVKDSSGRTMPDASVNWTSSSPGIVSVSATGLLTAKANGSASITARSGSAAGAISVQVNQVVTTLEVAPADIYFTYLKENKFPSVFARDARGALVAGVTPAWTLSNPLVASLFTSGPTTGITAQQNGWSRLIASYMGLADTVLVHVTQVPAGIRILPTSATIDPGDSASITVRYVDRGASLMDSTATAIQLNSLSNSVASVTADQQHVLAYRAGRTVVRARVGTWSSDMGVLVTGLTIPRDTLRTLGGTITADRIVQADSGPVRVVSEVNVPPGVKLTIGPGVTLLFQGRFGISVSGTLVARGSQTDSIRFVSDLPTKSPGDWAGIVFGATAADWVGDAGNSYAGGSSIAYAVVTDGGGIWVQSGADVLIEHNRVARNKPVRSGAPIGALAIAGGNCSNAGVDSSTTAFVTTCTVVRDNVISDNPTTGVDVTAFALLQRNLIQGNTYTLTSPFRGGGISLRQSSAIVMDNRIIGNTSGYMGGGIMFEEGAPTIIHNDIRDNVLSGPPHNGAGIGKSFFASAAVITDNHLQDNSCTTAAECSAVFVTDGFTGTFSRNNFMNPSATFEFYVNNSGSVSALSNYWGKATSAEIDARIYDQKDDATRALVNYTPFATTPLVNAGPRP